MILSQFLQRRIIPEAELPRFDECIQSAMRLRNSTLLELGLVALVFAVGRLTWQGLAGVQSDTWYATVSGGGDALTRAGYWYMFFSVPVSQFIMLRWYFRIFVWSRMLWQLSRLSLNLVASHPDRHCGLGFLGGITFAMGPLLLAHSAMVSGALANRILYAGTKLTDHGVEAAALAGFLFLLTYAPISAFAPVLIRKRLEGLRTYGALASEYVIDFEKKWMSDQRPTGETLVGSSDIQSLADMNNSYSVVQQIRPFPFGRESLIGFAVFVALPLLPLLLTMFSMRELALRLLSILL